MDELSGLFGHNVGDFLVTVAKADDGDAGKEVDVFLAVNIPHARTLAAHDAQRVAGIGAAHQRLFTLFQSFESFTQR